jgi:23S rRNA U2552 (ribose-2'-O)-methylase RlmE/FtsJ
MGKANRKKLFRRKIAGKITPPRGKIVLQVKATGSEEEALDALRKVLKIARSLKPEPSKEQGR